jgi:hypothetical protein
VGLFCNLLYLKYFSLVNESEFVWGCTYYKTAMPPVPARFSFVEKNKKASLCGEPIGYPYTVSLCKIF